MLYQIQIFTEDCHKTIYFETHQEPRQDHKKQKEWENLCYALSKLVNQKIDHLPEGENLVERVFVVFLKQMPYKKLLANIGKSISADLLKILKTPESEISL